MIFDSFFNNTRNLWTAHIPPASTIQFHCRVNLIFKDSQKNLNSRIIKLLC